MMHTLLWWAFLLILQLCVLTTLPRRPILLLIHAKMNCKLVYIRKRSQTIGFQSTISAEPYPFLSKTIPPLWERAKHSHGVWSNSDTILLVQTFPAGLTTNPSLLSTIIDKDQHISAWLNIVITFKTSHLRWSTYQERICHVTLAANIHLSSVKD